MKLYYPEYYKHFRCIAGACPDSCCKEWTVDVDQEAAERYRQLEGALGHRLRQVLRNTQDGWIMDIEEGRCPMWRQDGLCRIQAELGHDALCQTCRDFPRLRHDYGDFAELGLELSCPEAARLILSGEGERLLEEEHPGGEEPEYESETMEILRRSREQVLEFLKEEQYTVPESLAIVLLYGYSVQGWLDGGQEACIEAEACLAEARNYVTQGDREAFVGFFKDLEILTDRWAQRLIHPAQRPVWDLRIRRIARYFVQRYWLQSVSDYDLVSRVKLTVSACLLIAILGGDVQETAQQLSKEIENDPDNVEALLDGAYTAEGLTDVNMLSLLLG